MRRLTARIMPALALTPAMAHCLEVPTADGGVDLGQDLSALPVDKLLQMSGALGLVLVVIAALAWFLRRYNRAGRGGQGELALLGGLALGGRERLMLVRAGQDRVLIGVAPGQIRALHVLSGSKDEPQPSAEQANRFESTLSGILAGDGS